MILDVCKKQDQARRAGSHARRLGCQLLGVTMRKKKTDTGSLSAFVADKQKDPTSRRAYEVRELVAEIGRTVRTLREAKGLTQAQLAKLVGTGQPSIARLENGSDHKPRIDTLWSVVEALGMGLRMELVKAPRTFRLVAPTTRAARQVRKIR